MAVNRRRTGTPTYTANERKVKNVSPDMDNVRDFTPTGETALSQSFPDSKAKIRYTGEAVAAPTGTITTFFSSFSISSSPVMFW